jgi:hypothetical protein
MKHRNYRGKGFEIAREWFTISVPPDGERTLRARARTWLGQ